MRTITTKIAIYLLRNKSTRPTFNSPKLLVRLTRMLFCDIPYRNEIWRIITLLYEEEVEKPESEEVLKILSYYLATEK